MKRRGKQDMSPKFKTDTCRFAQLVTRNLVANNEKLVETHRNDFTFPFCTFTKFKANNSFRLSLKCC